MTAVFIGYVHLRVSHRIHRDFKSLSNKSYKKDLVHINNKVTQILVIFLVTHFFGLLNRSIEGGTGHTHLWSGTLHVRAFVLVLVLVLLLALASIDISSVALTQPTTPPTHTPYKTKRRCSCPSAASSTPWSRGCAGGSPHSSASCSRARCPASESSSSSSAFVRLVILCPLASSVRSSSHLVDVSPRTRTHLQG